MSKESGYITISRGLFNHFLWEEEREFSKAEAWLDLIRSAWYSDRPAEKIIEGKLIRWDRGQVAASLRYLQRRWYWGSANRVKRFLETLEECKMVEVKTEQGINVITLCKYDEYNGSKIIGETATEQQRNTGETATEHRRHTNGTNKNTVKKVVSKESISESADAPPIYKDMMKEYYEWFERRFHVGPKVDAAQGNALKTLIKYYSGLAKRSLATELAGQVPSDDQIHTRTLEFFKWLLDNWERLDSFNQAKTKLTDINSNIQNLIVQIKKSSDVKSGHHKGVQRIDDAASQILAGAAGQD